MFQTKIVEKIKAFFFAKIVFFMRKCGKKNHRVGQAKDDNMALAHCMLDT